MIEYILFWIFAILATGGGLGVVLHRNPVKSALFLVVTLFALAGEYVLLTAHFIAIVHIAVYAGAIMVLFLFVIMLLNVQIESKVGGIRGIMRWIGFTLSILLFGELGYFGFQGFKTAVAKENTLGTVESIGTALFSKYVLPFEVASILLLAAMIGAVYLSKRRLGMAPPVEEKPVAMTEEAEETVVE
ncbi:MAG: NADH-quinone oxidoreductase subunit J [Methanobacteriota archaeon]|nr:MAG: NADH-quinone oxidoreductase subunit J [Euryarchaeota archaeon]